MICLDRCAMAILGVLVAACAGPVASPDEVSGGEGSGGEGSGGEGSGGEGSGGEGSEDAPDASDEASDTAEPVVDDGMTRGQILARGQWCRGAAPGPGEMERAQMWSPASRHVLVRPGDTNTDVTPIAEFDTVAEGRFEVRLGPGTWCFVEESKREVEQPASTNPRVSSSCLAGLRRTCDTVLVIEAGQPSPPVGLRYINPCSWGGPCYTGPRPP